LTIAVRRVQCTGIVKTQTKQARALHRSMFTGSNVLDPHQQAGTRIMMKVNLIL